MNSLLKTLCSSVHFKTYHALSTNFLAKVCFSTNQTLNGKRWLAYNDVIFEPQGPNEEKRPAYVCHEKLNIKYYPKKMWTVACMIRGMSLDEALKQLKLVKLKGALIVAEILLEAQKKAVEEHNVEYKSNLWVAESFSTKGIVIKGIRRHAKGKIGTIHYRYCHYYVRLEEGEPPQEYYAHKRNQTGPDLLNKWLVKMRERNIHNSL